MSDLGGIESVGAKLVLLGGAAFRSQLEAATAALKAFNDEQERTAELSSKTPIVPVVPKTPKNPATDTSDATIAAQDAAAANAERNAKRTVAAQDATAENAERNAERTAAAQDAAAANAERNAKKAAAAEQKRLAAASAAAAKERSKALSFVNDASTKILKWGSVIGGVAVYEGVKKYLAFQQQGAQGAINAGLKPSQLPAFQAGSLKISDATGINPTTIEQMGYYLASANPSARTNMSTLLAMMNQAASLNVLAGNSADPTAIARSFGAIVSNRLALTPGGKPLTYGTAGGTAIGEWINSVTGHGDVTVGALSGALGTGILPIAKTYGISLNELGAAFDVLSPAMNANSASTRLKTALGMLGSPSQKTAASFELFGGNVTTAASLLRSKGLGALLTYMNSMFSGKVTGKTFDNPFYGTGKGTLTGGSRGQGTGAGEALRAMGFTVAQAKIMETEGGVSAFAKMSPTQLAAAGFGKGTTSAQAVQDVKSLLYGGAFGSGHTGAAVLQLGNEVGTYQTKLKQIVASENPKSYNAALSLAFNEPIVKLHQFDMAINNLTIAIGQDLTPAVLKITTDLLAIGSFFGSHKSALKALEIGGLGLVGGAALVKTVAGVAAVTKGIGSIFRLFGGGKGTVVRTATTDAAETAAEDTVTGTVTGTVGSGLLAAFGTVAGMGATAAALYGVNRGANWLSSKLTGVGAFSRGILWGSSSPVPYNKLIHLPGAGSAGVDWSGAVPVTAAPKLKPQAARAYNLGAWYTAHGQTIPGNLRAQLTPSEMGTLSWFMSSPAGSRLAGAAGSNSVFTKSWAPASSTATHDWLSYLSSLSPQNRKTALSGLGALGPAAQASLLNRGAVNGGAYGLVPLGPAVPTGTKVASTTRSSGGTPPGIATSITSADKVPGGPELIAAAAKIGDAAMKYSAELARMMTADNQQQTAATTAQNSANSLNNAANNLDAAAARLEGAAASAEVALSSTNIHALANAGARHSVARK